MNRSPLATCLALLSLGVSFSGSASAQTVLFSDSFENGLTNWTAGGFWHVQNDTDPCAYPVSPFPEGRKCAYYGIDATCNYETGINPNVGDLRMANAIALPTGFHRLSLKVWMRHDTEPCDPTAGYFDQSDVQVSTNGGGAWTTLARRCFAKFGSPNSWNPRSVDLTPYAGQSILIRFHFDSVDGFGNDTRGVFVDDVMIQGESGTTFCTSSCPCGGPFNFAPLPEGLVSGCRNSTRGYGVLAGDGTASVSADSLVLRALELPGDSVALLVQGSTFGAGGIDGEGRACLSGPLVRVAVRQASNGIVQFPAPSSPSLSVLGFVPGAGGTRHYQVRYRDNALNFCNRSNYNWTNGYSIVWTP